MWKGAGKGGRGQRKAGMTKGKDRKWKRIKGDQARVLEGRCHWGKSDCGFRQVD